MYCPKCGFKNSDEMRFCGQCGQELPVISTTLPAAVVPQPAHGVTTVFITLPNTKIELLESTDPEGPIGKFIEKKGAGIHHLAFAFADVDGALKDAESKGIALIDKTSRKGAEGLSIGFLHPKSTFGVLTEFCGKK